MIVRYPDMPHEFQRPVVTLLGSCSLEDSWYPQAARYLDRAGVTVIYGHGTGEPDFAAWMFQWLLTADMAVVWIDGEPWADFEVGYVIGRSNMEVVAGCSDLEMRDVLNKVLMINQKSLAFCDLDTTLTFARTRIRAL